MKTPTISIEQKPDLRTLLEEDFGETVDLQDAVWRMSTTPGVQGFPLGDVISRIVGSEDFALKRMTYADLREDVRRVFGRHQEIVIATETKPVDVGVYWLDVPQVRGCTASLSLGDESQREVGATVNIVGFGGSGDVTFTVGNEVSIDPCPVAQIARVSVPVTFERVEHRHGNRLISRFDRISKVDKRRRKWTVKNLTTDERPAPGELDDNPSFDLSGAASNAKEKLSQKVGTSWEVKLGVKLDQLGVDLSLVVTNKGSYEETVVMTYALAKGRVYTAESYMSRPGHWWRPVQPREGRSLVENSRCRLRTMRLRRGSQSSRDPRCSRVLG